MGRRPRIHFPGACFHVIVRGNNRQALFRIEQDRLSFGRLLAEGAQRFGHRIHAFCLMKNHVHLAVEVLDEPLSTVVHNFASRYAKSYNKKYGRTGHLFERRYRAGLVETDRGLQRLVRYIHLNPIRAGLSNDPVDYPWSSHAAYLGRQRVGFLTTRTVLGLFSPSRRRARTLLAAFVQEGIEETTPIEEGEVPDQYRRRPGEQLVADYRYEALHQARSEQLCGPLRRASLDSVLQVAAKVTATRPESLPGPSQDRARSRARALAAFFVQRAPHLTLRQLGRALNRDSSTLSRGAAAVASRREADATLEAQIRRARILLAELVAGR